MNKVDGELVASRLVDAGFAAARSEEEAEIILFNTCAVREHAEDRVFGRLLSLKARKRRNPGLVIGVLGCMAQEHRAALRSRIPHVDLVVGTREFGRIDSLVREVLARREAVIATGEGDGGDRILRRVELRPNRAQAFVNVIRGCNMPCTYCIVPSTRGPEVSRPLDQILAEAARLCADGVTELTLLGQTVNAYGHDLERGTDFAKLLREVHGVPGLRRLSFITSHPSFLDSRLMETMAALPKLSRYFHLPAQSGSDRILRGMKRGYTREKYLARIRDLRSLIPDMEFASDWIVGFPGETEEDHEDSVRLLEEVGFSQSFVFKYSPRKGTVSGDLLEDDVPEETKKRRNRDLLDRQERISLGKNRALVGTTLEVLVLGISRSRSDRWTGRTARNRLVHFPIDGEPLADTYVKVRILEANPYSLVGELCEVPGGTRARCGG